MYICTYDKPFFFNLVICYYSILLALAMTKKLFDFYGIRNDKDGDQAAVASAGLFYLLFLLNYLFLFLQKLSILLNFILIAHVN